MVPCQIMRATAATPGAIAIIQLAGSVDTILAAITGREDWPVGHMRFVALDDIDEGLAVKTASNAAQLMPHGGPRVVQRLIARLVELGADTVDPINAPPHLLYPEAEDDIESLALHAIARAASPLAIDLLLAQPAIWRSNPRVTDEDSARSRRLSRLIDPPFVVLAGPPNVGKSTLSNTLLGRSMSIALDMPGTTRDYTAARVDLAGLVVNWHDTPGLCESDDPIEQRSIDLAQRLMQRADLLLAMTDAEHDWPQLSRPADLRVASKSDMAKRGDADVCVSGISGDGVRDLVDEVRNALVSAGDLQMAIRSPWLFDERLPALLSASPPVSP